MAMGHVILKEFFIDSVTPYFRDYVSTYTDAPFLVRLEERDGALHPSKFLTASDLPAHAGEENAEFKPVLVDSRTGEAVIPQGSLGHRYGEAGVGKWNLDLQGVVPALSLLDAGEGAVEVRMPAFDGINGTAGELVRGVPVRTLDGHLVTTVHDLMLAQYGVARDGLPGEWPTGYDDAETPYTPAWQETITSVPASAAARIAREFAQNAVDTRGRSMILMGAGTNHWFHSDTMYRSFLALLTLTGCQGVNGGGWAHYVGQEKVRPVTGHAQLANALDWSRPPRNMIQTAYWYLHTDQWRYDQFPADTLSATTGPGDLTGKSTADIIAQSARMGWMPSYPTFNRNPLDLSDEAAAAGVPIAEHIVAGLKSGELSFAAEDPDAPENFPRVLAIWRANLLGSSGKGNEYFLKHLLGTDSSLRADETTPEQRSRDVRWHEDAPEGKLDMLVTFDFRQTSTTLFSDVVLPAATWYEKHDLNTTDMHPFIHSFNPAIAPPWQTRTDWDAWQAIADRFSELAVGTLDTRTDVVAVPLTHDTPDAMANPHGVVRDWKAGECEPVPGVTMPKLVPVERDYTAVGAKMVALGPLMEKLGTTTKGVTYDVTASVDYLRRKNGAIRGGVADGRPSLKDARHACEAILALSGTTNGHLATQGFKTLEKRTGKLMHDLAAEHEGKQITFADTQNAPVPVITSPEWSGSESGGRRYSPFTINVERLKPWHTLTGRMHFYLDHDWMTELGEGLPVYRPPLNMAALFAEPELGHQGELGLTLRYLTPHNKWSIHSEYQDNLFMLSLSRGGQNIWMSQVDADKVGIKDNDWIEAVNRNGVVVARAIVSHRMPEGTVYMHHAQDRLIDVPLAEASGKRGGIHNSLTRILIKPSHLIGGYAQLSFAFNYLGPTGNQRDEVTVIRKRSQEVQY
jgi:nitrate reductase / nitrite oxidoreductase, alpha subunit